MSEESHPEKVEQPDERLNPAVPPPDEHRWWEMQLGKRLLDRLYTGDRSGR